MLSSPPGDPAPGRVGRLLAEVVADFDRAARGGDYEEAARTAAFFSYDEGAAVRQFGDGAPTFRAALAAVDSAYQAFRDVAEPDGLDLDGAERLLSEARRSQDLIERETEERVVEVAPPLPQLRGRNAWAAYCRTTGRPVIVTTAPDVGLRFGRGVLSVIEVAPLADVNGGPSTPVYEVVDPTIVADNRRAIAGLERELEAQRGQVERLRDRAMPALRADVLDAAERIRAVEA